MPSQQEMFRIAEELAGKHIFVTGGAGFMGKVLIEKLLRSCPNIACIHLLLRPKKGVDVQGRLKGILETPLFEPLLKTKPDVASKLNAVPGDCSQLRLGLSDEDEAMLAEKVSYVFHAAATVRFDEPFVDAVLLNTRGTREMVMLCKKMKNLKVLQHVSTTYTFTNEPLLKEECYETELNWRAMIRLAETQDRRTLDIVAKKILGFQPNTYTFSKALAENVINDVRNDIPCIIFRPSVVVSSMFEPFPGWIDNLYGPVALWVGVMKGVLRYAHCDPDRALNFTPVDWAIRGMIVCALAKAQQSPSLRTTMDKLDVLNLEGSRIERKTFRMQTKAMAHSKYHASNPIRYPRIWAGKSYVYYWLGTMLSSIPYALAVDTLLRISGQKPRLMSVTRKIFYVQGALSYFMFNEFPVESKKYDVIDSLIHPDDALSFRMQIIANDSDERQCDVPADSSKLNYNSRQYEDVVVAGAFKYALKEEGTVEATKSKLRKLYALEILMNVAFAYVMYLLVGKPLLNKLLGLASVLPF